VPIIWTPCDSLSSIGKANSSTYDGKDRHICHWHDTIKHLLSNGINPLTM